MSLEDNGGGLPKRSPGRPARLADVPIQLPETVGMPTVRGHEYYSGLRRGSINSLVLPCAKNGFKPPVKSISLKKPGCVKGTRLIVLEGKFPGGQMGLLTYLRKLRDEQTVEEMPRGRAAAEALAA